MSVPHELACEFPPALETGMHVRVVAPARSLSVVGAERVALAVTALNEVGLSVSLGNHVWEIDKHDSSSIASRVDDLHAAFADPGVDAILTAIGGYNTNQLLPYINYELIAANKKVFCGYSDVTALHAAFNSQANMVSYYGPHFSTWSMLKGLDYCREEFLATVNSSAGRIVTPSSEWSDDEWYLNQGDRTFLHNHGPIFIKEGQAQGRLTGGYLRTFASLFGTRYMPSLKGAVVLIEETSDITQSHFLQLLDALFMQPGADKLAGVAIGRFAKKHVLQPAVLQQEVETRPFLYHIPIVANMDFGHTYPMTTLPLGSIVTMDSATKTFTIQQGV